MKITLFTSNSLRHNYFINYLSKYCNELYVVQECKSIFTEKSYVLTSASNLVQDYFKNAIIEPEKVIAPTAAPIDISIKLANLIFPTLPKLKAPGFKKAAIATNTAAKPTKLWKPATNSGIAVIGILKAIKAPIAPPITRKIIT